MILDIHVYASTSDVQFGGPLLYITAHYKNHIITRLNNVFIMKKLNNISVKTYETVDVSHTYSLLGGFHGHRELTSQFKTRIPLFRSVLNLL